eukprot:936807-Prymnesium_polylepis.1
MGLHRTWVIAHRSSHIGRRQLNQSSANTNTLLLLLTARPSLASATSLDHGDPSRATSPPLAARWWARPRRLAWQLVRIVRGGSLLHWLPAERSLPGGRRAVERARLAYLIVKHGVVHRRAVVPHDHIVLVPAVAVDEVGRCGVFDQLLEQRPAGMGVQTARDMAAMRMPCGCCVCSQAQKRPALGVVHALKVVNEVASEVERVPPGARVRANDRVDARGRGCGRDTSM